MNYHLIEHEKNLGIETALLDLNGDWDELNGKTFDTIVAGEIIEHLYYREGYTARCCSIVSQRELRGFSPQRLQFKESHQAFLGEQKNTSLEDPTHINHFSLGELNHLLCNILQRFVLLDSVDSSF